MAWRVRACRFPLRPILPVSDSRDLNTIEEAAADWLVRRDRGLTPAQEREFAAWLDADAAHAAVFQALDETWTMIAEAPAAVGAAAGRDAAAEDFSPRPSPRRGWRIGFPLALAAAAAVAIVFFGWRKPIDAERAAVAEFATTATTEVGEVRSVRLPDGSTIQLNTDSAVEVKFQAHERRVLLVRGEAHFTVASNRARPFIVGAKGVDVRVVGTVFNVRLRSEAVDVLVTEGKVRVGSPAEREGEARPAPIPLASELTAGQKVSILLPATPRDPISPAAPARASSAEIKQTLAWQTRRLDFDATPLADIVGEINRYNRHKLIIDDARLHTQRFGGSFPAGDYETFVRMLEANFGVIAERGEHETRLRAKP